MPSTPREDSPFLSSAVQRAMGPRTPGTPSTAGKPGVQAGRVSYPAPPGVNSGAPGRPASGPAPAPGAFPSPPTAPAPPAAAPRAGGSSTPPSTQPSRPSAAPGVAPPAQPPGPPAPGAPAAPQALDAFGQPVGTPTAPTPPPPGSMMPGAQVQTPMGTVTADPATGEQKMALSPEGQQRYKEQTVKLREKLGPMPKLFQSMPGLPEFPVEVGGWNYNPFTGRMEKG